MCGRISQYRDEEEIGERFQIGRTLFDLLPRYNVAPTQTVAVVGLRHRP